MCPALQSPLNWVLAEKAVSQRKWVRGFRYDWQSWKQLGESMGYSGAIAAGITQENQKYSLLFLHTSQRNVALEAHVQGERWGMWVQDKADIYVKHPSSLPNFSYYHCLMSSLTFNSVLRKESAVNYS